MSTTPELIRNKIESTIVALTPTADPFGSGRFVLMSEESSTLADQPATSGTERTFEVLIGGGSEPAATEPAYHHPAEYEAICEFLVVIQYPREYSFRAQDALMSSDRKDIKSALDNPTNWLDGVIHQIVPRWDRPEFAEDGSRWTLVLAVESRYFEAT